METAEPLFTRDGAVWRSSDTTGGPFGGLHGGAVSGLIVAEMEREAEKQGLGVMLSAQVLFLRPAPKGPLTTRTTLLRKGGRAGALETELIAEEKLIAKGIASCVAPRPVEDAPAAAPRPRAPAAMPPWRLLPRFAHPTLFDVLDFRIADDGTKWGRLLRPLVPYPTTLAPVFAVADNGQPLSLLGQRAIPRYAFPNIDLALHLSRAPQGAWIGVEASSDWRPDGMGLTEAALHDEAGPLGRACQTIVLMPPN